MASDIQFVVLFVVGVIVAFVYDWRLTLVIMSLAPLLVVAGANFSKMLITGSTQGQTLYAGAGGIADEALTLIRTVVSFGTQNQEVSRYANCLVFISTQLHVLIQQSKYFILWLCIDTKRSSKRL